MNNIAVVDDGVSRQIIDDLKFDIEVNDDLTITNCENNKISNSSHGTLCSLIIKKYAPSSCIGSVKILNSKTRTGYIEKLIVALKWCMANNISIVNLSLGSTRSKDYAILKQTVDNIRKSRIIIVAAICNENIVTYPASFSDVIGVSCDRLLEGDSYYLNKPDITGIDIYASSKHDIIFPTGCSNSFATPFITAKIYNIMSKNEHNNLNEIKLKLYENIANKSTMKKIGNYSETYISINREIPCIVFLLHSKNKDVIIDFNHMFIDNDYDTLFITNKKFDLLDNMYVVNHHQLCNHKINTLIKKTNADIVIIGLFKHSLDIHKSLKCDILFKERNNKFNYSEISYEKDITFNSHNKDITKQLYQLSLNLLN